MKQKKEILYLNNFPKNSPAEIILLLYWSRFQYIWQPKLLNKIKNVMKRKQYTIANNDFSHLQGKNTPFELLEPQAYS